MKQLKVTKPIRVKIGDSSSQMILMPGNYSLNSVEGKSIRLCHPDLPAVVFTAELSEHVVVGES